MTAKPFTILAGLLTAVSFLGAQEALPPIQFSVPYRCANGTAYVIERCEPGRRGEVCFYRMEMNGQPPKQIVNVRSQLTGILNTCPAPAASRSTPPAASTPGPANLATLPPQAPIGIPNRATDPPHLREMPVPERVIRGIQGTNPMDTLARQLAVLGQLERAVERMMDVKRYRKTADEEQAIYTYSYAAYELSQAFARTHSVEDVKALATLRGRYDLNGALAQEAIQKFYSPAVRAAHAKVDASFEKRYQDRVEAARQDRARQQEPEGTQQPGNSPFVRNDPGTLAARRCIELGGSDLGCVGKGLMTGFFGEELSNAIAGKNTSHAGLTMTGRYGAAGNVAVWFGDESMGLGECGKLVPESHSYRIAKDGNRFAISVQAEPKPFVMSLGPDGMLTGPGAVDITGRIITGYRRVWMQAYANGQPLVAGSCSAGPCGYWGQEAIYAAKTERCTIGVLRPTGPTGTAEAALRIAADMASGKPAKQSAREAQENLPAPGVRMTGTYGTQGGIALEFRDDSVVLDCGEAHVSRQYSVENTPSHVAVNVKNANSPFTLAIQANGALVGPGSVDVTGRVVTGSTPDGGIAYGQRTGRCALGTLLPGGASSSPGMFPAGTSSSGQAPASGAATGGSAVLSVSSGLKAQPGYPNPLNGLKMYLVKESFASVAAKNGVQPTGGQNAIQAWGAACDRHAPECSQSIGAIKTLVAGHLQFDIEGRASFPAMAAGRYFVFGFMLYEGHHLVWDLPVDLKNGGNSVVLDLRNAYSVK